jgi:hypothetical protein
VKIILKKRKTQGIGNKQIFVPVRQAVSVFLKEPRAAVGEGSDRTAARELTYRGWGMRRDWNNRVYDASKLSFPRGKEFL